MSDLQILLETYYLVMQQRITSGVPLGIETTPQ
jgi:hypothetical protein